MIDGYIKFVRRFLPSPFSIALLLTALSLVGVVALNFSSDKAIVGKAFNWWAHGLWTPSLLVFAMQMMLMLVLGHVLALTPAVSKFIHLLVSKAHNTASAAAIVSFFALSVGLFNWGLGLIFGAILARKVGESFSERNKALNYALIGAAGYAALMIWHGGISGSALIKVAEPGNLQQLLTGVLAEAELKNLPERIGLEQTVFSLKNILTSIAILIAIPTSLFLIGSKIKEEILDLKFEQSNFTSSRIESFGAERFDNSQLAGKIGGGIILSYCLYLIIFQNDFLSFFNPNNINLTLLGLSLLLHKNISSLLQATDNAISGASGILLQFPLYFGIMGLFRDSGMIENFSNYFVSISNETTFPIFTFLSAGIVNIFVPSGGGQWVIQGPVIVKASLELGIPLHKSILALAYGDQITNMLQPFWALPLLGITKLSAKDILPYTLIMFLVGFCIFIISVAI
tara:strand:- start:67 stop:1437 length:1371 start_codon:yes stop_codon:yes gene_type:complete